jgi:hypothetical protein
VTIWAVASLNAEPVAAHASPPLEVEIPNPPTFTPVVDIFKASAAKTDHVAEVEARAVTPAIVKVLAPDTLATTLAYLLAGIVYPATLTDILTGLGICEIVAIKY